MICLPCRLSQTRCVYLLAILPLTLALAAPCWSQSSAAAGEVFARPSVAALEIDQPMVIDGVLDEAAWQQADVADEFYQREPEELQAATERTEFSVLYDQTHLYVGVRAFDSEPEAIVALEMGRDVPIFRDDGLVLLIDTFHDRRNAYFFETNANSSRTDGLVTEEGRDFSTDWDAIWQVRCQQNADGWTAEFEIPLSTLRFDPEADVWGLQVRRIIKRKAEITFWAPIGRDADLFRMSQAGTITGLQDLEAGRDLRFKPFVAASSARNDFDPEDDADGVDGGLDVKWGVTQGLTLDLTVNTDFAETEVDEQQTNLTRFSLFFPEKREFFLENAGIFDFGPQNGPTLLEVFFSRRIGIADDGRQVDLDYGARLAGRQGPWSLGVLGVRTGSLTAEPEDGFEAVPETNWGVVRVKRNVGERSSVGAIVTSRDSADGDGNQVFGIDADYKPTDRLGLWSYAALSEGPGSTEDDWSGGLGAEYGGSFWEWSLDAVAIGDDFSPRSGFLRRTGRRYTGELEYSPRPDLPGIRNLNFELESTLFTRQDGSLESLETKADLFGLSTDRGDFVSLFTQVQKENLREPFEIFTDVVLPADDYRWQDFGLFAETTSSQPVSVSGFVVIGDFFDGDRKTANVSLFWRPSKYFRSRTSLSYNDIELSAGAFSTSIIRQRLEVSVHPDLGFDAFIQHNDAREDLSVNLRANWHYRPGSDLFVVYNQGWDASSLGNAVRRDRQLIIKLTYSLGL